MTQILEEASRGLASLIDVADRYCRGRSLLPLPRIGRTAAASSRLVRRCFFAEGLVVLCSWLWCSSPSAWRGPGWPVGLLSAGVVIRAMSAMLARCWGSVHAGEYLVKPLHWLVERSMKHKTATVVLTILRFRSVRRAEQSSGR